MNVIHRLEITAVCPADKLPDVYACEIHAARVIPVEHILSEVENLRAVELYQEDLCQRLHRALACRVVLIGSHSGVQTTVTCG